MVKEKPLEVSITIDEYEVVFEACSRRDAHLVAHDLYSDLCNGGKESQFGPSWAIHSVEPLKPGA